MRTLTAILCLTLTILLGGCVTDGLLKSAGFSFKSEKYSLAKQGDADAPWSNRTERKYTKELAQIAKNKTVMVVCNP
jgi:hypothetical protein